MNRGIRDIGIVGPTGPKGPTCCLYCQGGIPLMEEGEPRDDDYNCVWIDKQGRLQQKTDAMSFNCIDTAWGDDGKQLNYCPMCGRPLGGNEDED